MPTSLYFTTHIPVKQARPTRSSICSIPLALDIEDSCRQTSLKRRLKLEHFFHQFGFLTIYTEMADTLSWTELWIAFLANLGLRCENAL